MKRILLISSIALCFSACNSNEKKEDIESSETFIEIPKEIFEENGMQEVEMVEKKLESYINCTGFIDAPPQNRASVSNYLGGYVEANPLLVGDKVNKGDIVLQLENPDFIHLQENYLALKAELELSEQAFERQSSLYADSIGSKANYQQAKSEYEVKKARKSALEQKLKLLGVDASQLTAESMWSSIAVKAPISGIVSEVNTQLGAYVSPQAVMLEIIDGSHLHLELEVYEKDIAELKVGQAIRFQVSDVNGEELIGDVHLIGNTVDAEKRTVKVHGHVPDSVAGNLQVGMFVKAKIQTEKQKVYTYPERTVIKHEDKWKGLRLVETKDDVLICEIIELAEADELSTEYHSTQYTSQKLIQGVYHYIGQLEGEE